VIAKAVLLQELLRQVLQVALREGLDCNNVKAVLVAGDLDLLGKLANATTDLDLRLQESLLNTPT
jgi:hypothetical protein